MNANIDFQQLFNVMGDAVIVSDPNGVITLWNPAAERIFGYSQNEALGETLDLIIPEKLRTRHWDGYYQTMQTGKTRYTTDVLRVPALNKAGERLSIAFTVALLNSPTNDVTGIVAVVRDETAQYEASRGGDAQTVYASA